MQIPFIAMFILFLTCLWRRNSPVVAKIWTNPTLSFSLITTSIFILSGMKCRDRQISSRQSAVFFSSPFYLHTNRERQRESETDIEISSWQSSVLYIIPTSIFVLTGRDKETVRQISSWQSSVFYFITTPIFIVIGRDRETVRRAQRSVLDGHLSSISSQLLVFILSGRDGETVRQIDSSRQSYSFYFITVSINRDRQDRQTDRQTDRD